MTQKPWLQTTYLVKAISASVLVGTIYGAVSGAAFGAVLAGPLGGIFGFGFGAIGGIVCGMIGGGIGGPVGWGFGGFVGGLVSSSILDSARPDDIVSLAPAFILATLGLIIGFAIQGSNWDWPLTRWLRKLHREAKLLRGLQIVRVSLAIVALSFGGCILYQRFTAPTESGSFLGSSAD